MRNIALLDVDMTNVHAAGTIEMMKAAQEAIDEVGAHTKLIAVTQLTSTSEDRMRNELWIDHPLTETVQHYAHNAEIAGLAGVVCSPLEADLVHQVCGENFLPSRRASVLRMTPRAIRSVLPRRAKAREIGADYIVVGRSITASKDPVASYRRCVREFVEENNHEHREKHCQAFTGHQSGFLKSRMIRSPGPAGSNRRSIAITA